MQFYKAKKNKDFIFFANFRKLKTLYLIEQVHLGSRLYRRPTERMLNATQGRTKRAFCKLRATVAFVRLNSVPLSLVIPAHAKKRRILSLTRATVVMQDIFHSISNFRKLKKQGFYFLHTLES